MDDTGHPSGQRHQRHDHPSGGNRSRGGHPTGIGRQGLRATQGESVANPDCHDLFPHLGSPGFRQLFDPEFRCHEKPILFPRGGHCDLVDRAVSICPVGTGGSSWFWSKYIAGGCDDSDARQILITKVAKSSPADGLLEIGDVVTGLNGQAFGRDARRLLAQAVTGIRFGIMLGSIQLDQLASMIF